MKQHILKWSISINSKKSKYVVGKIQKQIKKIYTKIQYIERIQNSQIRNTLYRKLFNYNKIIHFIKTAKYMDTWMNDINDLFKVITSPMTTNLQD